MISELANKLRLKAEHEGIPFLHTAVAVDAFADHTHLLHIVREYQKGISLSKYFFDIATEIDEIATTHPSIESFRHLYYDNSSSWGLRILAQQCVYQGSVAMSSLGQYGPVPAHHIAKVIMAMSQDKQLCEYAQTQAIDLRSFVNEINDPFWPQEISLGRFFQQLSDEIECYRFEKED
jgi:hypothetical protein